jgi:uncharacterized protein involved in type VI secretion and phage assembly
MGYVMDHDLLAQLLDWVRSRYFGKYRGTVSDNADAAKRGRLKVKVPAVLGDLEVWAMPCVPYAGDQVGFYCLPEAGTGVWVEFEGGDPSFAIWSGCFWADGEIPGPEQAAKKTWRTGAVTMLLDDDAKEMSVEAQDGGKLTVGDDVKAEREQASHTVSTSGVTAEMSGKKADLSSASFSVNDGALEVT